MMTTNNCGNCIHNPVCNIKNNFKNFVNDLHDKVKELYQNDGDELNFYIQVSCKHQIKCDDLLA